MSDELRKALEQIATFSGHNPAVLGGFEGGYNQAVQDIAKIARHALASAPADAREAERERVITARTDALNVARMLCMAKTEDEQRTMLTALHIAMANYDNWVDHFAALGADARPAAAEPAPPDPFALCACGHPRNLHARGGYLCFDVRCSCARYCPSGDPAPPLPGASAAGGPQGD